MLGFSPVKLLVVSIIGFASLSLHSCSSGEEECTSAQDCGEGLSCVDGSCVQDSADPSARNPAITDQCMDDADCINPTSACSSAEGASCVDGVCDYPELRCDSPPADRCIDGGTILVRSGASGTCDEDAGGCVYEEEEIPVDPANCETIAAGGCEAVECPDTECAINGVVRLGSPSCECRYAAFEEPGTLCEDLTTLCTTSSSCNSEGGCENDGFTIEAGGDCRFRGEIVLDLDEDGFPSRMGLPGEDGAPRPFCETDGGRCIECTDADAATQCDDGNPCTEDSCNDGLCVNLSEPANDTECTLEEGETSLFGNVGLCADGACVQCDSANPDASLRDAACVRQDLSGDVNACLEGAVCVDNRCEYDLGSDPAEGAACLDDAGESGVCLAGGCVQCVTDAQCEDDGNPCTDVICGNNVCTSVNKPDRTRCLAHPEDIIANFCVAGVCVACAEGDIDSNGNLIDSPSMCNDLFPIVKDGVGMCITARSSVASCDDGNACTRDTCVGGTIGEKEATCQSLTTVSCDGQCEAACDRNTGRCMPDAGASCDDGNACTINDRCSSISAGVCLPGTRVSDCCTSSSQCPTGQICSSNRCRVRSTRPPPPPPPPPRCNPQLCRSPCRCVADMCVCGADIP